jgi:hypothetical protein
VEPSSIKHSYTGEWNGAETKLTTCGGASSAPLAVKGDVDVIFTYDVKWEFSDIKWASRWDTYLLMGEPQHAGETRWVRWNGWRLDTDVLLAELIQERGRVLSGSPQLPWLWRWEGGMLEGGRGVGDQGWASLCKA